MPEPLPAISLVAVPGRRRQTLDIARDIERRGFAGIYMPSRWSNMAQCTGLALATERIRFGTAIAPIYAADGRRIRDECGLYPRGVRRALSLWHRRRTRADASAARHHRRQAARPIPAPLSRSSVLGGIGALPPIVLAALRKRMVALAAEIAEGVLFANASLSHMTQSLAVSPRPSAPTRFPDRQHAAGMHHR